MPSPSRRRTRDSSTMLLLLTVVMVLGTSGCQRAREENEGADGQFFEPLTSLPGTSPSLLFSADHRESDSLSLLFIDSLQTRIDEQDHLIRALRKEISRLRNSSAISSTAVADSLATTLSIPARAPITYEQARVQFAQKNYRGAIRSFRGLINSGIDRTLADDCQLLIGRSFFHLQQYNQALSETERVLEYHDSDKLGEARFLLGQCHEVTGNSRKAREMYETVVQQYPGSEFAAQSRQRLVLLK